MNTESNSVEVRAYGIGELATIYKVTPRTIRIWLAPHQKAIGIKSGRYYTALQVRIIFEKLGLPGIIFD